MYISDQDNVEYDEELEPVPEADQQQDPLFQAKVQRTFGQQRLVGTVAAIEQSKASGERYYRISYEGGLPIYLLGEPSPISWLAI